MSPRQLRNHETKPLGTAAADSTLHRPRTSSLPGAPGRRRLPRPAHALEVAAGRVPQAGPAGPDQEPGHVRRRGRLGADHLLGDHPQLDLRLDDHRLALAHRALRQPGRGGRRGPRQGAGRDAAADQAGDGRAAADRVEARRFRDSLRVEQVPGTALTVGDYVVVEAGAGHPRRRRRRRRRRLGRRVGHHRRVGPGHPRVRRRPLRGHRRHQGAVGPDRGAASRPSRARRSSTG